MALYLPVFKGLKIEGVTWCGRVARWHGGMVCLFCRVYGGIMPACFHSVAWWPDTCLCLQGCLMAQHSPVYLWLCGQSKMAFLEHNLVFVNQYMYAFLQAAKVPYESPTPTLPCAACSLLVHTRMSSNECNSVWPCIVHIISVVMFDYVRARDLTAYYVGALLIVCPCCWSAVSSAIACLVRYDTSGWVSWCCGSVLCGGVESLAAEGADLFGECCAAMAAMPPC